VKYRKFINQLTDAVYDWPKRANRSTKGLKVKFIWGRQGNVAGPEAEFVQAFLAPDGETLVVDLEPVEDPADGILTKE